MDNLTTPVVTLAAELGVSADQLATRLGDDALTDATGFRAVERHVAARLLDEHRATQAKTKQRGDARRRQLAEVSARARATIRGGIPATSDSALADLLSLDGTPPRIQEAEDRLDAWLAGRSTGARISPRRA